VPLLAAPIHEGVGEVLSGLELVIVGISEIDEDRCRACAAKKYGSLRAERIAVGLECRESWHDGPQAMTQYRADEEGRDRGYDCGCERGLSSDEFCDQCAGVFCVDCGKRLDEVPCAV
jgi:hypothetical protein